MARRCWIDGRILAPEQAMISVYDHGLLYGDGVFEGVRIYNKRAFRLRAHLERLWRSMAVLRIVSPYAMEHLVDVVENLVNESGAERGYLRIMVTRGVGKLGIDPRGCLQPSVIVLVDDIAIVEDQTRQQGARLIIAATRRLPPDGLDPRVKSLNYLNHIMAKWEAINAQADEAILLNAQGYVSEGSADNIFIVKDSVLMTPPCSDGALAGITREIVLQLARAAGIEAREAHLAAYDLYTADECFLTGTAAELIPVREIDGRAMGIAIGPIFTRLNVLFRESIALEMA